MRWILAIFLLVASCAIVLRSSYVQTSVKQLIIETVKREADADISINTIELSLPCCCTLRDVEIKQNDTHIKAKRIHATILPWQLMQKKLSLRRIAIDSLQINDSPPLFVKGMGSLRSHRVKGHLHIGLEKSFTLSALVSIKMQKLDDLWKGLASVQVTTSEGSCSVMGSITHQNDLIMLDNFTSDAPTIKLQGSLALHNLTSLENSWLDIASTHPMASGNLNLQLSGPLLAPRLAVRGFLETISYKDMLVENTEITASLAYHNAKLGATWALCSHWDLQNYMVKVRGELATDRSLVLVIDELRGPNTLLRGTFSVDPMGQLVGSLDGSLATTQLSHLQSRGTLLVEQQQILTTLTEISGLVDNIPVRLLEPVTFSASPTAQELSPLHLEIGEGSLVGSFFCSSDKIAGSCVCTKVPLEAVSWFVPGTLFTGLYSGNLSLQGSPENPQGSVEIDFTNLRSYDQLFNQLTPWDGHLALQIKPETIEFSAEVNEGSENPIIIDGEIPFHFSFSPFALAADLEAPLHATIHYDGNITPFLQLLPADSTTLQGKLLLDIVIAGSMKKPELLGSGKIYEGIYESISFGSLVTDIEGLFIAHNNKLELKSLKGMSGSRGTIQGTGWLVLDADECFPFALHLEATNARLLQLDFAKGRLTGKLALEGNAEHGSLTGKIVSDKLVVYIPETSAEAIVDIPVTYVNQSTAEPQPTLVTAPVSDWPLVVNLELVVPGNGEIRNNELRSTWQGEALLSGTVPSLHLKGGVSLVRGDYMLNGQLLSLAQGTILFNGDALKDTTFYVMATQEIDPGLAEIIVKGPLLDPMLTLRSTPPLPPREVLSWILFGTGASDISQLQSEELTHSIAEFSKSNSSSAFLSKVRSKIGIDRIDLQRSKTNQNEFSVKLGKYLTKGMLISVDKSMTSDASRLGFEAKLKRHFKIEAEVSSNNNNKLFLKWKKNY